MWHVGVLRGPRGCFFGVFFSLYLDNCECIDIISPACCAFSLCYPFQGEFWEEGSWQSEALFLVLHSSLSLSLQVGPDGGFGGRIDRRLPPWCQRRPRFVRSWRRCQDSTLKKCPLLLPLLPVSPSYPISLHLFLHPLRIHLYAIAVSAKQPSLFICHSHCTGNYKPEDELCVGINC